MNRQDVLAMIAQAKDVPPAIRAAGGLFVARLSDAQLADLGDKAQLVTDSLKAGDLAQTRKLLTGFGLPAQYIEIIVGLVGKYGKRNDSQQ